MADAAADPPAPLLAAVEQWSEANGVSLILRLSLIETLAITGIALFGFGSIGGMLAGMREEVREVHRAVSQRPRGD